VINPAVCRVLTAELGGSGIASREIGPFGWRGPDIEKSSMTLKPSPITMRSTTFAISRGSRVGST